MTPRILPAVVSTAGLSYLVTVSAPKAGVVTKPLNRLLAIAAPPPASDDLNSARRPTLLFNTSWRGLPLPFHSMGCDPLFEFDPQSNFDLCLFAQDHTAATLGCQDHRPLYGRPFATGGIHKLCPSGSRRHRSVGLPGREFTNQRHRSQNPRRVEGGLVVPILVEEHSSDCRSNNPRESPGSKQ